MRIKISDDFFFVTVLLLLLITTSTATVSTSMFASAGGIISSSQSSYETSGQLGPGWTTYGQDIYQHGGMTSRIVSSGPTGVQQTKDQTGSRTEEQNTAIESTGKINIHDSGGIWSTQTNIPQSICENGNYQINDPNQTGRYPETQESVAFADAYGTGQTTKYNSRIAADDKYLGVSAHATIDDGLTYWSASGRIVAGFDMNDTVMNYIYKNWERAYLRTLNETPIDVSLTWEWDQSVNEIAAENTAMETPTETEEYKS